MSKKDEKKTPEEPKKPRPDPKYCPFCHVTKSTHLNWETDEFFPGLRVMKGGFLKEKNQLWYAVKCDNCGARGPQAHSRELAIYSWNSRGRDFFTPNA